MSRNIGTIKIADELILAYLDFADGGRILSVTKDTWGTIDITIEHPDMPSIGAHDKPSLVCPRYTTTSDSMGHSVTIRDKESR